MYNLENMNDYEFELLCKDIMEEKLHVPLHTFPQGPDGGIDICDSKDTPEVIVQAKHYFHSQYSTLLSSLKKEIVKVKEITPQQYYICTSMQLTKKRKAEIYSLFKDYMNDWSNIIDKIEINDFLEEEKHDDIVRKHYKLWLCASNVLTMVNNRNVFVDCEELISDIEDEMSLFVQTKVYFEARQKLNENKMIILVGAPGVGKSTISKMLLMYFANEGYAVRYTTDNDISSIKKTLSRDQNKKEIILIDDFLGQHYLKIKDTQPNELKTLISYVQKNTNKKLILNSRITIINEAKQSYLKFNALMKKNDVNQYIINLDEMPLLEKAKILYNHLYFSELPHEYFSVIKTNSNYFDIISHKNYNPRIIEYVTKYISIAKLPAEEYYDYVIKKLNNPEDVWRDEFRNRLSESDRVLMNTLYSLTDTYIDADDLKKAFNKRLRLCENTQTTINTYKNVIKRLNNSLIKQTEIRGKIRISTINPSVNDFLKEELRSNINEQLNIIDSAIFIEQILKMPQSEEHTQKLIQLVRNGELLTLSCFKNSPFYYFIRMALDNSIYDITIKDNIRFSFERLYVDISYIDNFSALLYDVLNKEEFMSFYHLKSTFLNSKIMYFFIEKIDILYMDLISNKYIDLFNSDSINTIEYAKVLEIFRENIIEKLYNTAEAEAEDDLFHSAETIVNNNVDVLDTIDELDLANELKKEVEDQFEYFFDNHINSFSEELKLWENQFYMEDIINGLDYDEAIRIAMENRNNDYEPDAHNYQGVNDFKAIRSMFER